ncbi:S26 family signal peptidase [Streptomyces sp. BR123]|uniref:S26 family signal peptidase n=1 Tax=Streptomyces sp. BR123 TaxID=2749828 RepID=UPI0015C4DBE8|nr:S26 family signal peptidase [Streptomyces sp. BR123]NXY96424.1 S26 family signal peptidase [Streptomyces sp. BR123]
MRCSTRRAVAAAALGLAGAGAAALLLRYTVVRVTVRGSSMAPLYEDGARVLVHRGGRIAVGRVVVLERPAEGAGRPLPPVTRSASPHAMASRRWIVKRVAAVSGDPAPLERVPGLDGTAGAVVPPGRLVLLGDNPANSYDSRQAGYFPVERVLGTVLGQRRRP